MNGVKWEAMTEDQLLRRMWERFAIEKNVDQIGLGRCRECEATKNGRQVATRDAAQEDLDLLLLSVDLRCAKLTIRGSQAMEQII